MQTDPKDAGDTNRKPDVEPAVSPPETPESDNIKDEGDPLGANFA